MASSSRYRRFMQLVKAWPLDKDKIGRDIGAEIREAVAINFRQGEASQVDTEKCERIYQSLQRINSDAARKKYPRVSDSVATGRSLETCRIMTSTEVLTALEETSMSLWQRFKLSVLRRKTRT